MSKPEQIVHSTAAHLTDGEIVFQVPQKYVKQILDAVSTLRHDFSDLGGKYVGKPTSE